MTLVELTDTQKDAFIQKVCYMTNYSKEKSLELLELHNYDIKKVIKNEELQISVVLLTRYTEYNEEQSRKMLENHNNDVKEVLKEYEQIIKDRIKSIIDETGEKEETIIQKMKTNKNNKESVLKEIIEEKVLLVTRQTTYTVDEAREKLSIHNGNPMKVIREFMGVTEKKAPENVSSLNQEIYKQIRYKLNDSMRDYNKKKDLLDQNAKL